MKKIYVYLLLVTNVLPISCMEIERKELFIADPYGDFTEIPLNNLTQQNQNYLCTANEPGWEKLNNIANGLYSNNKAIVKNPTDLKPIYRPTINTNNTATTKKQIKSQEKKPFLKTIVPQMQPDYDLMEKLCINACRIFYPQVRNQSLTSLIQKMNSAKTTGITEDIMGNFSCSRWWGAHYKIHHAALLFGCLKKPGQAQYNQLAQDLGIINNSLFQENPTYNHLKNILKILKTKENFSTIQLLACCLYSNEKTVIEDYFSGSYTNLTEEFHKKASDLFLYGGSLQELYNLVQIIDRAKTLRDIQKEKNLGYAILAFEPPIIESFFKQLNVDHSISDIKNRISLLCLLIKKYNQSRGSKTTPTGKQNVCYKLVKDLDLALPDSFNNNLFDQNCYAFEEFEQLKTETATLMNSEEQTVHNCVTIRYPQKK